MVGKDLTKTKLDKRLDEMLAWWTSETREYRLLIVDLLSGLPGSDDLAEYFMIEETKNNCGWKEIDLLVNLFGEINTKDDVEKVSKAILKEEQTYAKDLRDV
jgi:3-methyladenine DNA glycosylase AlkD